MLDAPRLEDRAVGALHDDVWLDSAVRCCACCPVLADAAALVAVATGRSR